MSSPDTDFFKQFEEKKKKIKILILGPYSPVGYSDKMVDIKTTWHQKVTEMRSSLKIFLITLRFMMIRLFTLLKKANTTSNIGLTHWFLYFLKTHPMKEYR